MIHKFKNNRMLVLTVLGGGLLLIIMGIFSMRQSSELSDIETEHAELEASLSEAEQDMAAKQAELNQQKTDATIQATGLDPNMVSADTEIATDYFSPAFSWTNGEEYNTVRDRYEEDLGSNNAFTDTYLPEDTTIDTNDGELMYIDYKGVRTQINNMIITPLFVEGDQRIRYMAIAEFYMHLESEDLANTSALDASHAVIEFTMAGPEGSRSISEVDAWSGFASSINE